MDTLIETEEYKGYAIELHQDEIMSNPREWDNVGTMICWHKGYELGDKHEFKDGAQFRESIEGKDKEYIIIPLYLIDHSGISINTNGFSHCDPQAWDWGQVGYIFVTKEKALEEFKGEKWTAAFKSKMEKHLLQEVKDYDNYLRGDGCGFIIKYPKPACKVCGRESDMEIKDSSWGYIEYKACLEDARTLVDCLIKDKKRREVKA